MKADEVSVYLNAEERAALMRVIQAAQNHAVDLPRRVALYIEDDIRLLQDRLDAAIADSKVKVELPTFPWCGYCHNTVTEPHSSRNGVPYHTECLLKEMEQKEVK